MGENRKRKVYRADYEMLMKMHGTTCRICGAEPVQYHHIIPVSWGGTDDINNFLPLCFEHHATVHGVMGLGRYGKNHGHGSGRPRKISDGWEDIVSRYLHCEIGMRECKEILGLGSGSKLPDKPWFKEYLREQGIVSYKNKVDIIWSNEGLEDGRLVGFVEYRNGEKEEYYWDSEGKDYYDEPPENPRLKKKR